MTVSLVGDASRDAYNDLTKRISDILAQEFGIAGTAVYVIFRPVESWGWDGHLF